ncbi:MAG: bifunctional homocysteine S-methyltransferase/methylenetetrahydrofolate reductase [Acidobacteriota bacterium]|nr:bifunctional homocysteine S-methyltransferase/methylenetetrahydrofolate reductase [Acidobacteriota bacterium]
MDISFRERLARGECLLFDGGMGTELYAQGVFLNKCYEELNLVRPGVVEAVHRRFLQAGAQAVETNSFAASRPRLEPHGLGDRVHEINAAAARLAREAVGHRAHVAGAVGPLGIRLEPWGPTTVDEAVELFKEQISGLMDGGIDLVVFETFTDLVEIQAAVRAAREVGDLPVVAMMTVDEEGRTLEGVPPEWMVQKLEATQAEVIGINCSVGPASMLPVLETLAASSSTPLAAMPNAGIPRPVEGRMIYLTSPTYMGRYARRFRRLGAKVIGGCCGVTPEHVQAMSEALGQDPAGEVVPKVVVRAPKVVPREPVPRREKSRLARRIADGRFVTLVEMPPPHGWEARPVLTLLGPWLDAGVDGVVVPDDPRVSVRLSPMAMARLVHEEIQARGAKAEPVLQYTCRDRNLLGMQSDLLGTHALGLRNLFLVTGNAPRPGAMSWSSTVFDVDAIGLTNMVFRLNHGLDVRDTPIGSPTAFFPAVLATLGLVARKEEVRRFEWKVDAGAEFALTSPVFDPEELISFLEAVAPVRIPMIAGLWVLTSLRDAEYLAAEVPGVTVPEPVLERMAAAARKGTEAQEGLAIAREILGQVRDHVEGVFVCGQGALQPGSLDVVAPVLDSVVTVRRDFPGRPGIKGGAEGKRYRD